MRRQHIFPLNLILRLLPPPCASISQELAQNSRKPHPNLTYLSPIEEARKALQQGEYAQALSLFSLILQKNPNNNWAWHGRGDSFQWLGSYREAEKSYRRASTLQPTEGIHYAGIANALQAQGKAQESKELWKKALFIDPNLTWMRKD